MIDKNCCCILCKPGKHCSFDARWQQCSCSQVAVDESARRACLKVYVISKVCLGPSFGRGMHPPSTRNTEFCGSLHLSRSTIGPAERPDCLQTFVWLYPHSNTLLLMASTSTDPLRVALLRARAAILRAQDLAATARQQRQFLLPAIESASARTAGPAAQHSEEAPALDADSRNQATPCARCEAPSDVHSPHSVENISVAGPCLDGTAHASSMQPGQSRAARVPKVAQG